MAQLIKFVFTPKFKKQYKNLPINTQNYRFTFQVLEEEVYFLTIGIHNEGLGKK